MAGALAGLGVRVGPDDEFLDPTPDNPAGYYENRTVVECNDAILQNWFPQTLRDDLGEYFIDRETLDQFGWLFGALSVPNGPLPAGSSSKVAADDPTIARISAIVAQIEDRSGEGAPVIVKDPRLSLLLPFWITRLTHPIVIVMLRQPNEVAKSLARRDGLPCSLGYGLWLAYNQSVFAGSEGVPRLVVDYGELLGSPETTLGRVMHFVTSNGWQPPENAVDVAASTLRPELRHEDARAGDCPKQIQHFYDSIRAGRSPPVIQYDTDWHHGLAVPLLNKFHHMTRVWQHELQQKQGELENALERLEDVSQRMVAAEGELVRLDRHPVVGRVLRLMRRFKRDANFGKRLTTSN